MSSSSTSSQQSQPTTASTGNCSSTISLNEITYNWKIDNFSSKETNAENSIFSPIFSASTNDDFKWCILLKPRGNTEKRNYISVFLVLKDCKKSAMTSAKFRFYIQNEKKEIKWATSFAYRLFVNNTVDEDEHVDWGWHHILEKNNFFKTTLLVENILTITCELTFFELNDANMEPFFHRNDIVSLHHLSEDFASVLKNPGFSDVVLSIHGKDYPAHKVVLSARSRVFAAMFNHDTKENKQNRVEITDMHEDVMEEMLKYIYAGNCENVVKLAEGLLVAADKYDLGHLKKICEESLSKNLTVENVLDVLLFADTHHASQLKSKAIDFIVTNSSHLVNTAAWNSIMLSNASLLNEVFVVVLSRQNTS